jgi:cytochrome c2
MNRLAVFTLAVPALLALAACSGASSAPPGGDAAAGAALITRYGCGSCHSIPGIVDANGLVGPPLARIASRQFIAGVLRNTPDNMVQWLRFPQRIVPGNAMPDLAISETDARQLTAYLETLR